MLKRDMKIPKSAAVKKSKKPLAGVNLVDGLFPFQRQFFENPCRRKIWLSSRQIGKSHTLAAILVSRALKYGKQGLSIAISTGQRAATELIRKCQLFAEAVKIATNGAITYDCSFDNVTFSTGARVMSLPSCIDGHNCRGFSCQTVCCDEFFFLPWAEAMMNSLIPVLTRFKDSQLIMTSTPGAKSGYAYNMYKNAIGDPNWYIQTTTIHDAKNAGLDIDIEELRKMTPDPAIFAQEYECTFVDESSSMLDPSVLDWHDIAPQGSACYLGMDIGRDHDKSSIVVLKTHKGKSYVDYVEVLDKVPYDQQLQRVRELHNKYKFTYGYLDKLGIGSAFSEQVSKNVSHKLQGVSWNQTSKTPAYEYLRGLVFEHKISFNNRWKNIISDDFLAVKRVVSDAGNVKFDAARSKNGHADVVSSIVLACQAAHDHPSRGILPTGWLAPTTFTVFLTVSLFSSQLLGFLLNAC